MPDAEVLDWVSLLHFMVFYPLVCYPRQDTTNTTANEGFETYLPSFVSVYIASLFLFAEGYSMSKSKTEVEDLTGFTYRIELIRWREKLIHYSPVPPCWSQLFIPFRKKEIKTKQNIKNTSKIPEFQSHSPIQILLSLVIYSRSSWIS